METAIIIVFLALLVFAIGAIVGIVLVHTTNRNVFNHIEHNESSKHVPKIHPLVKLIYTDFIQNGTFNFIIAENKCTMYYKPLKIEIWVTNNIENRKIWRCEDNDLLFNSVDEKSLNDLNNNLTMLDKRILHKIFTRVDEVNKEFINKVFI